MCRVCMGRVCYVPSLLWAEFVMCRVDPAPPYGLDFLASLYRPSNSSLGPPYSESVSERENE